VYYFLKRIFVANNKKLIKITFGTPLERFVAFLIDTAILFLFLAIVGSTINTILSQIPAYRNFEYSTFFLGSIVSGLYFMTMLHFHETTIGKKIMGLKVVRSDHKRIGPSRIFAREGLGKTACNLSLGLGYLWIIFDKKGQGLHDKIAGTVVVKHS